MSDLIDRQAAIDAILGQPPEPHYPSWYAEQIKNLPSAQLETYKENLNEIASALSEKFAYMNTCLNERDIILGYLGVKRCCETHCNTDCTNTKSESHPSFAQPERKRGRWVTHKELHKNMCYYIKCSKCGKEAIWTNGFSLYPPNFCPNCGVDMKEGDVDG